MWEAADQVGGRIRTDRVDGFLLDHGFQLLNPAYPAVRRWVDVDALDLQPFGAGVVARTGDGPRRREPCSATRCATRAAAGHPAPVVAPRPARPPRWPAGWRRCCGRRRARGLAARLERDPDVPGSTALDAAGADGLLRRVAERFLSGTLLEDDGSTADGYVQLLARTFLAGVPGLPDAGMQALPQPARGGARHPRAPDQPGGVGDRRRHRCDGRRAGRQRPRGPGGRGDGRPRGGAAHRLPRTGDEGRGDRVVRGPGAAERRGRYLHVDARPVAGGPLVNVAVVSAAAPSYAPSGRHLVAASALMGGGRQAPASDDLRRHAGDLLGCPTSAWETVGRHEVPHALPAQPAPLVTRRPQRVADRVLVAGDHRDTGSIQGALVSGERAARAVLRSGAPAVAVR